MEQKKTVNVLKAMADETRLSIVHQLAQAENAVSRCDIVNSCSHALKLSQPAMSHHFGKLVDAEVILVEKQGTQNLYFLNKDLLTSIGFDVTKL